MGNNKLLVAAAGVLASALAFTACTPQPAATQSQLSNSSTAVVAWNQGFYSYNDDTTFGNATANANIIYMTTDEFTYYDKDLKLLPNKSFGSYEKLADKPTKVKQTLADTATWSDGVPVTAADLVLQWGALSENFNTYTAPTDETSGEITKPNEGSNVFFNSADPALAKIKTVPSVGDGGKSITYEYTDVFIDWEYNVIDPGVPAHIVGKRALGIADPTQAAQAVADAFKNKDKAALAKISNVWNSDFNFKDMPADKELVLSTGPYVISDLKNEQYTTVTRNPNYKGERKPSIDTITVRVIPDPQASVQAVRNGEVLFTQPQATADILKQMQELPNATVLGGESGTYEHVDMAMNNKGPFDPASYGGDAEKARKVREAFLHTIPRQQIIDTIIKPLNPAAGLRNSFTVVPGAPNYADMENSNGMKATYGAGGDIDKAKALLAEVGVKTPVKVRFLSAKGNTRREQEFQLIKESADKAGFDVIDRLAVDWVPLTKKPSYFDATLFGWQSTSTAVGASDANYRSKSQNNPYGYSNKAVDDLFDDLSVEQDPAKQKVILEKVEKILVTDSFGITIFQHPQPTAVSNRLQNVSSIALSPTVFWNYWEWKLAS